MASELALKIAEIVDLAAAGPDDSYVWRGLLSNGEEWKICVTQKNQLVTNIVIKNRTTPPEGV
jgi:hypothetical protein